MPREMYPEYKLRPVEDVIELCNRCKAHLVFVLPVQGKPWCRDCGGDEHGTLYIRVDAIRVARAGLAPSALVDTLKGLGVL